MQKTHALVVGSMILTIAACGGDGQSHGKHRSRGAPPGLEIAMLATSDVSDASVVDASVVDASVVDVSVDNVANALASGSIRLIDIRTPEEVAENGTIPGADHIPMDQLDPALLDASEGREVVLYCRSGARSEMAASKLAKETGKPVSHMAGGILAWDERTRLTECRQSASQSC